MRTRLLVASVALACAVAVATSAGAASSGRVAHVHVAASASVLSVPPSSLTYENAEANAVSCAAPTSCTGVGFFGRSNDHPSLAVLWSWSGSWGSGQLVASPTGAGPTSTSTLTSVSCSGHATCLAVGTYTAHAGARQQLLLVRERSGVVGRGVAVSLPSGLHAPTASVWCGHTGTCAVVGSATDGAGQGRLFALTASTTGTTAWHSAPEVPRYVKPTGLPRPNDGGSLAVGGFTCVSVGNCIAVGSIAWTSSPTRTLAVSELEVDGVWGPIERAAVPVDAVAIGSPTYQAQLDAVACTGAPASLAVSKCVAVGSYASISGFHQLVDRSSGGHLHVGAWPQDPTAGAYMTTACRGAGLACVAAGLHLSGAPHGEAGGYSVGTWAGFATMEVAPLADTLGGETYEFFAGSACLPSHTTCFVVGGEELGPGQPPIVLTLRGV